MEVNRIGNSQKYNFEKTKLSVIQPKEGKSHSLEVEFQNKKQNFHNNFSYKNDRINLF